MRDADDPDSEHDFGKDIIPHARRATASACSPTASKTAARIDDGAALLARRRHGRRVLGSEHGARARDARAQYLRRGLADLDLPGAAAAREIRVRRATAGAAARSIRWFRAAASSAARRCSVAAVFQRARPQLLLDRARRSSCPRSRSGAARCCAGWSSIAARAFRPGCRSASMPRKTGGAFTCRTRESRSSRQRCSGSSSITCASRWRESGDLLKVRRLLLC